MLQGYIAEESFANRRGGRFGFFEEGSGHRIWQKGLVEEGRVAEQFERAFTDFVRSTRVLALEVWGIISKPGGV